MSEVVLEIEGMHCAACIRRVAQALHAADGIEVKEIGLGSARIVAPESASEPAGQAIAALARAGYLAHPRG